MVAAAASDGDSSAGCRAEAAQPRTGSPANPSAGAPEPLGSPGTRVILRHGWFVEVAAYVTSFCASPQRTASIVLLPFRAGVSVPFSETLKEKKGSALPAIGDLRWAKSCM